jgi:hypothetical protein
MSPTPRQVTPQAIFVTLRGSADRVNQRGEKLVETVGHINATNGQARA